MSLGNNKGLTEHLRTEVAQCVIRVVLFLMTSSHSTGIQCLVQPRLEITYQAQAQDISLRVKWSVNLVIADVYLIFPGD